MKCIHEKRLTMVNKVFQLNDQAVFMIRELGGHMPGGFFIYKAEEP